jgi:5'-deoxynucleotidase YfbR-like HD superfamily hydrolase
MHDVEFARRGTQVRRYHTVNLIVPETVGHHSANVALLVTSLCPEASANLLKAALYHDLAEQVTGDIPATAKWRSKALKDASKDLEARVIKQVPLTHDERHILKQADMLDLCFKVLEELKMGNTTVLEIGHRGVEWLMNNSPSTLTIQLVQEIQNEYRKYS